MKELRSQIEIQASAERVWQLLTDFASFPQWNPFIRRASGNVQVGKRLEVNIQPSGASGMTFRPTVLKAAPNRELRWLGRLLIPGLFDGEHIFTIEPLEQIEFFLSSVKSSPACSSRYLQGDWIPALDAVLKK